MATNSPMPTRNMGTLGTLFLVARKTNQDVQSFPIDCCRVTIGRDFDCDIRLYFSDVSKLHCEILFDLLTNQATLHVHGGNGIKYTPNGSKTTDQKPPAILTLSSGDSFVLRKKLFRFEYGAEEALPTYNTPTKGACSTPLVTPARSVRRRASHRLSLVPDGKTFEPQTPSSKNRRKSVGPSKLSQHPEEQEQVEVDVVEAEEGYKVYMEQTEEKEEQIEAVEEKDILDQAASIAPSTPSKTIRVTAQVALTTPRGSGSLRKSLLLKSARKAWKVTQSPGVEGAIENGNVQIRRKSLSPKVVSPVPPEDSASEEEEEAVESNHDIEMRESLRADHGPQEFQWVPEEGLDASVIESESDASFEANESLEIPGQSVLTFTPPPKIRIEHESMQEGPQTWQDENEGFESLEADEEDERVEDDDEGGSEDEQILGERSGDAEAEAEAQHRPFNQFFTPQQKRSLGPPRRVVASVGPAVRFATGNPARPSLGPPSRVRREVALVEEKEIEEFKPTLFMTPSRDADRAEAKRRRQSLATPRGLPAPPASFRNVARETPRKLFATPTHPALKPSTPEATLSTAYEPPATPLDDIKRRLSLLQRQSATAPSRRTGVSFGLPATPLARGGPIASASRTVISKRPAGSGFLYNRSRPQTTLDEADEEQEEDENDGGLEDTTPSRTRNDHRLSTPSTPIVQPVPGSAVSSLFVSPDPVSVQTPTVALRDVLPPPPPEDLASTSFTSASSSENVASSSPPRSLAQQPSTPDFSAIRKMVYAPLPPKTPNFVGIKQMYPELPAPAQTPDFTGLKHMYPANAPKTPRFAGMREMLAEPAPEASSPDLGGLGEMYAGDEDLEDDLQVEATETDHSIAVTAKKTTPNANSRTRKTTTAALKAVEAADMDASAPSKARSTRSIVKPTAAQTRKVAAPIVDAEIETKSTSSRTRRAPTEDAVTATRTRRAATVEQVEQVAPSMPSTSRSPSTKKTETPASVDEAPSKPSRASRATAKKPAEKKVLGEASEQPTVEAEASSKPVKRKATTAPATNGSELASAPAKRTRAKVDKENEPEVSTDVKPATDKKAPARRAATKKAVELAPTPVSAPTTRSTRSRK